MSYVKGSTILAADLNSFLGTVRTVYGTGNGNRGYGQSGVSQVDVTAGSTILSSHWTNLRTMMIACANHQGTAQTLIPPSGSLAASQPVVAHEADAPSSNTYDFNSVVTALDTNRLTAAVGSMTLTAGAHTVTRATTWTSTITATVDVIFASEDAARFFFNTGGQIRLRPTHSNTTGSQNTDWNTVLGTKIGTVTMTASGVSHSGTMSASNIASSLGFYNLTTSAQNIVTATNVGGGAYASNDVTVTAHVLNKTGANGGNGNTIRFVIAYIDQHTGSSDTVASGTNMIFDHYRATTYMSGISAPTYSTIVNF